MDRSKIDARGEGIFFSLFFGQVLTSVMASWMKLPFTVFSHRAGLLPSSVHQMSPLSLPDTASHAHCGPDTCPGQTTEEWIIICPLLLNLDHGLPKVKGYIIFVSVLQNLVSLCHWWESHLCFVLRGIDRKRRVQCSCWTEMWASHHHKYHLNICLYFCWKLVKFMVFKNSSRFIIITKYFWEQQ